MTGDEIERQLRDAFAARAEGAVDDRRPVPQARFLTEAPARRRLQWLAPAAAAAAVLGLVGGVLAIAGSGASSQGPKVVGGHSAAGSATPATPATSYGSPGASTASEGAGTTVHIKLYNADNHTVGVAMPVIAIFSHKITNARPFVQATRVTVNGKPYQAAWYFERSAAGLGAMEAHLRPEYYWPPHSKIHVSLDTQGKAAGRGLTYDDSLTLDFTTGARTIATVDDSTNTLTVRTDGVSVATYPVSLGSPKTPTFGGIKVIMGKQATVRLKGAAYDEVLPYALRLTYSGEYLVGSPGDTAAIQKRLDVSNGCTDLVKANAARIYEMLSVGDPVEYVGGKGPTMSFTDGFGDWNVRWPKWLQGGLLPTS